MKKTILSFLLMLTAYVSHSQCTTTGTLTNATVNTCVVNINTALNLNSSIPWSGAVIPVSKGGTGQTTLAGLIGYVFPAQMGNTGKLLTTDGMGNLSWTGINNTQIISALGYTPFNPNGTMAQYVRGDGSFGIFPTNISSFTNDAGYLTSVTGSQVISALGYMPINPMGTSLQYFKGDGSLGNFPTAISAFTNDVGYVTTNNVYTAGFGLTKTGTEPSSTFAINQTDIMTVARAGDSINAINGRLNQRITLSQARAGLTLTTTSSSGPATYNSTTGVLNIPNYNVVTAVIPTPIASGARNFNQAYQLSATRPSRISVSSHISCNLSLTAGQSGQIILEISPNGTSGWIFCGQISGSNTGTLTIGLNTTQITGGALTEDLPAGYYWRLRTNNITGSPAYVFNGGNERIF